MCRTKGGASFVCDLFPRPMRRTLFGTSIVLLLLQPEDAQWTPETLRDKLKPTFREAEILMWIARGKTNKEIGIILTTSPRTVNKHLEHIFEKLGVSTRAAAMVLQRA